jgi:predicted amidohydrolase YtcJ
MLLPHGYLAKGLRRLGFRPLRDRPGRRRRSGLTGWVICPVGLLLVLASGAEGGSVIYENATVWTGDPAKPWAEAVWVKDGRIEAAGSADEVRRKGAGVPRVDLGGAFVCPGLVDAHAHVLGFGFAQEEIDLVGTASLEETLARVSERVAQWRGEEREGWIRGRGWDQNDWSETVFPTRQDLDAICPDFPLALTRIDGHALWVNSRALELAGVTADTPDPSGGRIHRDASGAPTGILVDTAELLVESVIPEEDGALRAHAVRSAVKILARAGLTGIHDMGMSADELMVYRELAREGEIGIRLYASISATEPQLAEVLGRGPDPAWRGRFRLGMVKFYVDGALGSRGAALLEPYSDDPGNRGLLILDEDRLYRGMQQALRAGFQCAVHAIGDRANRAVLDVWQALQGEGLAARPAQPAPLSGLGVRPPHLPAVRIEHAQIVHPRDLARFAELGVVASMQPTHCTSDMPWAPERLGEDRLAGAYAWRSLGSKGVVLAAGSDFPVESHDPRYGLYAAVTRRGVDGRPAEGWSPSERLGREEALIAFTAAPAWVSGDLHQLGTITPGKLADLTIFDRNLVTCDPEAILRARCLATLVEGEPVWLDADAPFAKALAGAAR